MDQTELAEEQKRVVRRYLEVWRRFRRLPDRQGGFVGLEDDMNKGSGMLLCGLLVEANAASVIIADVKDPKFHAAIFGGDDAAASDMTDEELQQARRYIIHAEGSAPVRRGPTHLPSALYSDTPNPAGPLRTERCTAER